MPGAARKLYRLGRDLQARLDRGETSAYAAALTYNFLFALFPMALALAAVLPALRLAGGQHGLTSALGAVVPREVVRLVGTAHGTGRSRGALALAGGLGYLLGMSAAFRRLMAAFHRGRATSAAPPPARAGWWTVALSVILALTLGVGLVAATVLMTLGQALLRAVLPPGVTAAGAAAAEALRWLILVALTLLMVSLLYWLGPEGRRPFRFGSPGALAAIAVWAVVSTGFSLYLSRFNAYNALYGSVGAVILLLLYLYFLSYALLLGWEVDALLAAPAGSPPAPPGS